MQEYAYQIVKEHTQKSLERNKKNYDVKVSYAELQPWNQVLVKKMTPRGGPGKLYEEFKLL